MCRTSQYLEGVTFKTASGEPGNRGVVGNGGLQQTKNSFGNGVPGAPGQNGIVEYRFGTGPWNFVQYTGNKNSFTCKATGMCAPYHGLL